MEDTIAAISTPVGEGGIGIVRLSGTNALDIANKVFRPVRETDLYEKKSHSLIYGYVYNPENEKIVDEVLLGIMRAPRTYTCEDVVEFNCHGGVVPLKKTLELVLKYGARPAEPGEFTRRAFLNGRLDLAQAESIIDVIRSKTDAGLNVAINQLEGKISSEISNLQGEILEVLANIEVSIDFSEDELGEESTSQLYKKVERIKDSLEKMLQGAEKGKIYREGIHTVIVGKPNVGKSSLLNALLRDRRAIVTEIPGTTRDIIEEVLNIKGIPLRLVDTAGLRETEDIVERVGVERSRELVARGDFILLVLDAYEGVTREDKEIIDMVRNKNGIVIVNKVDLKESTETLNNIKEIIPEWPVTEISVTRQEGLEKLEDMIEKTIIGENISASESHLISTARHKEILDRAVGHLNEVLSGIKYEVSADLVAIDVRDAWEALGEITGETVTEDLVEKIFADFCVGK